MEEVLRELVKLVGGCLLSKLVNMIKNGMDGGPSTQRLERQVASLTSEVNKLKTKLKTSEANAIV